MTIALPLHARLYPKADDESFVDAREIARRVQQALPGAVVDWARGDAWVQDSLQELIARGTPEVILAGHRHLFGQTVYISRAYPDWPERPVFTIVSGIQREAGDALFLKVTLPFDLDLLKRGAADFAAALDFEYCLCCDRNGVIRTVTSTGQKDPMEFLRWDLPADIYPTVRLHGLANWKKTIGNAVAGWLGACEYRDKIKTLTEGFASDVAFADAVIRELDAIAPVERGFAIDVTGAPHQNRILLDHEDWMTMVQLLGVLKNIVI